MDGRNLIRTLIIAALFVGFVIATARIARQNRIAKQAEREAFAALNQDGAPDRADRIGVDTDPSGQDTARPPARGTSDTFESITNARLVDHRGNTGDQFRLRFADREETFQLYWVQAPEVSEQAANRLEEQSSYFGGITPAEVTTAGGQAREVVADILRQRPFTIFTRWEPVADTSKYYAYILVEHQPGDTSFLCELLVVRGLAIITGDPADTPMARPDVDPEAYARRLRAYTQFAQQQRLGAWRFNTAAPAAPAG